MRFEAIDIFGLTYRLITILSISYLRFISNVISRRYDDAIIKVIRNASIYATAYHSKLANNLLEANFLDMSKSYFIDLTHGQATN